MTDDADADVNVDGDGEVDGVEINIVTGCSECKMKRARRIEISAPSLFPVFSVLNDFVGLSGPTYTIRA
jgi:hypothetical protein